MLHIRRYQATDHDAVWHLHQLGLHATNTHLGNGPWDNDLHQIETIYLTNGGEFLVGSADGQLVAMGALKRTGPARAEIKRMRVHPAWWRRGFGQRILTALEQRALELGYTILHLDTTVQQEAAQRLYEKHGFQQVRRATIGSFECIFYEKVLAEGSLAEQRIRADAAPQP